VLQSEYVKQRLHNLRVEISPASPQELDRFLKSQLQEWRKFLKDFNIQPENLRNV
jgi:tripartite-type tricarboxylate transporter receptor subunit TctC